MGAARGLLPKALARLQELAAGRGRYAQQARDALARHGLPEQPSQIAPEHVQALGAALGVLDEDAKAP